MLTAVGQATGFKFSMETDGYWMKTDDFADKPLEPDVLVAKMKKLIEQAEREVLIANAYFIPTPSILTALKDAAARCIAVTVVSNSPATNGWMWIAEPGSRMG